MQVFRCVATMIVFNGIARLIYSVDDAIDGEQIGVERHEGGAFFVRGVGAKDAVELLEGVFDVVFAAGTGHSVDIEHDGFDFVGSRRSLDSAMLRLMNPTQQIWICARCQGEGRDGDEEGS